MAAPTEPSLTGGISDDFESTPTIAGLKSGDRVLARFRLERCLGRGGMGEVWLVHDETLEEKLALKLLPRLIQFDDRAVEDLKNETRRGRQLSHPHIVRVFDFYQDAANVAIAMEFVDGENLASLQQREPRACFHPDRIVPWIQHLLTGLDYAHRSGNVVHRDLKPANLLIERSSSSLKVADFGIARCLADSMQRVTSSAQVRGTLCYMSPEQAQGRSANPIDDLYAVGATLYELLAGTPPFYQGDVFSQIMKVAPTPILERQREQGFEQPPPPRWESVIMQCLAKERSQRPQSAAEILEALGLGSGTTIPLISSAFGAGATTGTGPVARTEATAFSDRTGPVEVTLSTNAPIVTLGARSGGGFADATRGGFADATRGGFADATRGGFADATRTVSSDAAGTRAAPLPSVAAPKRKKPLWIGAAALLACAGIAGGVVFWKSQPSGKESSQATAATATVAPAPSLPATGAAAATPTPAPTPPPAPAGPKPGEDWRVPGDFATLQEAVNAASVPNQRILVGKGQFGRLHIQRSVMLLGAGSTPEGTVVQSDTTSSPLTVEAAGVVIEGVCLTHTGDDATAVGQPLMTVLSGEARVQKCQFLKSGGVGLRVGGGAKVTATACVFINSGQAGAWVTEGGSLHATDCQFLSNDTGLLVDVAGSTATLDHCTLEQNALHGMQVSRQGRIVAKQCQSTGNRQSGVWSRDAGSLATLEDCQLQSNEIGCNASDGGAATLLLARVLKNTLGIVADGAGDLVLRENNVSGNSSNGVVLVAKESGGTVQLHKNVIRENAGVGLWVEGPGMAPEVTANEVGPNGQLDVYLRGGAAGRYSANTLKSPQESYFAEPDCKPEWLADNQQIPAGAAAAPAPLGGLGPTTVVPTSPNTSGSPANIPAATPVAVLKTVVMEQEFVVIDKGSLVGMKAGMKFSVRRKGAVIGKVTLTGAIEESEAVADIDPSSVPAGTTLAPGDELIPLMDPQ